MQGLRRFFHGLGRVDGSGIEIGTDLQAGLLCTAQIGLGLTVAVQGAGAPAAAAQTHHDEGKTLVFQCRPVDLVVVEGNIQPDLPCLPSVLVEIAEDAVPGHQIRPGADADAQQQHEKQAKGSKLLHFRMICL